MHTLELSFELFLRLHSKHNFSELLLMFNLCRLKYLFSEEKLGAKCTISSGKKCVCLTGPETFLSAGTMVQ